MKKLLIAVIILAIIAAGCLGYLWYQTSHIFVEDAVYSKKAETLDLRGTGISVEHYENVRYQLPDCEIIWDVPFQGFDVPSNSTELLMRGVTAEDMNMLRYFTNLEYVGVTDFHDYAVLETLQAMVPGAELGYGVDLGGKEIRVGTSEIGLNPGEYDYPVLMENLKYLPGLEAVDFFQSELSAEQFAALEEAYPEITFDYTVNLLGQELDAGTTSLDLTGMTSADVEEVAGKLPMLAGLEHIDLPNALTLEEVKKLKDAAPQITVKYTFTLFGETITTDDEELIFKNKRKYITNDTLDQVRMMLDVMNNCTRLVLDNTAVSDENMAQLREDYRGKTKVVWRVYFGQGTSLTDVEVLRHVYHLNDDNSGSLKYLEDVRYMDLGHDEFLDYVDFVAYMPNLEVVIISGAPVRTLEPFVNCKKLKFLEMANCIYVPDLEPLRNCTELEMLNISHTEISDLSPIQDLPLTHLCTKANNITDEDRDAYIESHPDCWVTYQGDVDYSTGWRYDENGDPLPWYAKMIDAFGYPKADNYTGWYLDD